MKRLSVILVLATIMVIAFVSCKPSIPSEYIQKGKMQNILYEYHLAEELFNQHNGDSLTLLTYRAAILQKYGVTEAEFDSSLVYYTRHTKMLHDMYEAISDRLNNEIVAEGGSNSLDDLGGNMAGSDTTNVWKGDRCLVLSPYALTNSFSFEAKVDTSYHKGDRIILDFDTQFIYQDGMRDAVVVVAMKFNNDSIASQTLRLTSSSHYRLQIEDSGRLGIKSVKGYFMLGNGGNNGYSSTLRLGIIYGLKMLKMHVKDPSVSNEQNVDSTSVSRPDSAKMVKQSTDGAAPNNKPVQENAPLPDKPRGLPDDGEKAKLKQVPLKTLKPLSMDKMKPALNNAAPKRK